MTSPETKLLEDHAEMERLLSLLAIAVEANDESQDLQCTWSQVERLILDHISTEEREFFGLVARAHRAEVEELRADHQHIRRALAELGMQVQLHSVRKPEVDALIAFLRHHSERENQTLYRWLAERPDASFANVVRRMLERRSRNDHREAT